MRRNLAKIVCLALTMVLLVSIIAACESSDKAETKAIKDTVAETQKSSDKTGNEAAETTEAAPETKEPSTEAPAAETAGGGDVSIEEQVILDQNDVKITAKEYVSDDLWGDGIKLLVENNTDKNISVSCKALIVNNYMISDLFGCSVAAGKKANETLDLSSAALEAAGIDTVGQIEIYFNVNDADSWESIFETDVVTIRTSAFDTMDTAPDDSGKELYNEGGIRIVGKYVDENSFWGAGILLYLENNSGRNVGIDCENLSVNGFMLTPYFYTQIFNGKMAIEDITLLSSELEENDIKKIEEVELSFHIYDLDTYETIKDTDPIRFTVE